MSKGRLSALLLKQLISDAPNQYNPFMASLLVLFLSRYPVFQNFPDKE